MIRMLHAVAYWVLLTCLSGGATIAFAALGNKPPQDVSLASTAWQIDSRRSDDPEATIEKAKKEAADREIQGRVNRDVLEDDHRGIPGAARGPDEPWSGRTGGASPRDRLPDERTSSDVDPLGGTQTMSAQWGSARSNPFLIQLSKNPEMLSFRQDGEALTVLGDKTELATCEPGSNGPISDSWGDGEQRCGWDGRAWVVETKRGKQFTRKDRFELSKDGKTLQYLTTATGKDMPKIRISRSYVMNSKP